MTEHRSGPLEAARAHRERLHTVLVRVEKALAAPAGSRRSDWLEVVRRELTDLQQAFEDHIDVTEEPDGLFEEVLAAAPRLANAVQRLKAEHVEIRDAIDREILQLDSPSSGDEEEATADTRRRLLELLGDLAQHRQQGADLLYEAYEVDVGGLD